MGRQVGWRVKRVDRPKPWLGMAKIPGAGSRYESQSFAKEPAARAWAKARHAELLLEIPEAVAQYKPAGDCSTRAVRELVIGRMRKRDNAPDYITQMDRLLRQVEKVAPNLAHPAAPARIEALLRDRAEPLAPATLTRLINMLQAACTQARRARLLAPGIDPLEGIERPRMRPVIKDQFTIEEMRHLLRQAHDHFHLLFALMLYTGMRPGEAQSTIWEDVEFDGRGGGVIVVRKRAGRKLKTGERIVPLEPELRALLEPVRRASGPVVAVNRLNLNRRWDAFLAAHQVAKGGRTPHSCRHSYVGLKIATGEPTGVVRLYVGHQTENQTGDYGQMAARYRRDVEGWGRGELRLLEGLSSPIGLGQRLANAGRYERMRRALRQRGLGR